MSAKKRSALLPVLLFVAILLPAYSNAASVRKLIIAVGQEPTSMDASVASIGGDYTVVENWGEFLIYRTPGGDLKPGLASSWKMSPDGKEIEFTVRKGVKFHSGDVMTAKDIAFSFDRGREKNPTVRTRLKLLDKVEVIDDYRLKFTFKTPDVTFIPSRSTL